ncbi:M6 family metalloprotease domain-containing protein [Dysgonomonas capnocytophagoides]|uniref:M6 family metalloprotease domain-containing protein n=1 Tax=Dysgonomonas capnocytophagoides TaxID=45254 RepID=UPI00333EF93F
MAKIYNLVVILLVHIGLAHGTTSCKKDSIPYVPSLKKERISSTGEFTGLVILVEFSDTYFTAPNLKKNIDSMLNSRGYAYQGAKGSVRDYFITNSDSLFFPHFNVTGPVRLPKPMAYYGQKAENDEEIHAPEMIMEACKLASGDIDFSEYDLNDDGLVDLVYVIYASYCQNENISKHEYIYAHAGNIIDSCLMLNRKTIGRYACSSEYIGEDTDEEPQMTTIGTICHEFSHVLGLPDFYDTKIIPTELTLGTLSIMDRGNYQDKGRCPVGYSAFEREYVGWMDIPTIDPDSIVSITLNPVSSYSRGDTLLYAFKIAIPDTKEFFYFENRQYEKWDRYLPAKGLFIYHVDLSDEKAWDRNEVNINSLQNYQLIRSTGLAKALDGYIPFPGIDNKMFFSPPPSRSGKDAEFELRNIREKGNKIEFNLISKR